MKQTNDAFDSDPSVLVTASLQPTTFGRKLDNTKAELAYGSWGIPKLVSQILKNSDNCI